MKGLLIALMVWMLSTAALAREAASQPKSGREKIGLRLGYVESVSDIDILFGDGSSVTLHFTERIRTPVFLNITLGALYLGESSNDDVTPTLFGPGVSHTSMRILYFSASPVLELPVGDRSILYLSGGIGLYSISVLLDLGFFGSDLSDEHFGANAGAGLFWSITDNWKLDFNFTAHHVRTSEKTSDLFFLYSRGDSDPNFYQFSVGVAISLN